LEGRSPGVNYLSYGIVACETFRKEIDALTDGDTDLAYKEYVEIGLHEYPEELKKMIVEKVNSLKGRVDAVFLGYGICQSLKGITSKLIIPTVMLEAEDCVGTFLTMPEYDKERKKCAGTWYATPAFAEMGADYFERDLRKSKDLDPAQFDINWYLAALFDGYSRCLYVHSGLGDREYYESKAKEFSDRLKLTFESRDGTLVMLIDALNQTKSLAANTNDNA
jgi:hypothetical protein